MNSVQDIYDEIKILNSLAQYDPSQVLQNSSTRNVVLVEYRDKVAKSNKQLYNAINCLLNISYIYQRSYERFGAVGFTDLSKTVWYEDYKKYVKDYEKSVFQAKKSIIDKLIKYNDMNFIEVYNAVKDKHYRLSCKRDKSGIDSLSAGDRSFLLTWDYNLRLYDPSTMCKAFTF